MGAACSSGSSSLQRAELTREAIRLTRAVRGPLPNDGEVAGLLALVLLTDARRPARTGPDGTLIPLAEQDRRRWDADAIGDGIALITATLAGGPVGPYQLQAAIAAVHAEAARAEDTDWKQIVALYTLLERFTPNPMVTLNHAVAVAMVHGPRAGLDLLSTLDGDERLGEHHRLDAVRAHLLEMAGDLAAARAAHRTAAWRATSLPERRPVPGGPGRPAGGRRLTAGVSASPRPVSPPAPARRAAGGAAPEAPHPRSRPRAREARRRRWPARSRR